MQRDQFQTLCKTYDISASTILREWVESALKRGSLEQSVGPDEAKKNGRTIDEKILETLITRVDQVERKTKYLNDNQMQFIKEEVLGDAMGTLRNRMGVVENQIQELGGNISR